VPEDEPPQAVASTAATATRTLTEVRVISTLLGDFRQRVDIM
jgi:hypothetical protein